MAKAAVAEAPVEETTTEETQVAEAPVKKERKKPVRLTHEEKIAKMEAELAVIRERAAKKANAVRDGLVERIAKMDERIAKLTDQRAELVTALNELDAAADAEGND